MLKLFQFLAYIPYSHSSSRLTGRHRKWLFHQICCNRRCFGTTGLARTECADKRKEPASAVHSSCQNQI